MAVSNLSNENEYKEFIKSKEMSVVHFYAAWAEQCTHMNEVLEEMAKLPEYKNVKFGKIVAEDVPKITLEAGVSAVPTILLLKKGNIVDRVDGANPSVLTSKVKSHLSDSLPVETESKESLESKLKRLINQSQCMLFMKGDPSTPRCGFSRTIVSLLDSHNASYQTFDILQDNEVREGLKKFSNWPTYPQLYIKGELVGGLDIVKEMAESGDLDEVLPKKASLEER